jgi:hypothetical protein
VCGSVLFFSKAHAAGRAGVKPKHRKKLSERKKAANGRLRFSLWFRNRDESGGLRDCRPRAFGVAALALILVAAGRLRLSAEIAAELFALILQWRVGASATAMFTSHGTPFGSFTPLRDCAPSSRCDGFPPRQSSGDQTRWCRRTGRISSFRREAAVTSACWARGIHTDVRLEVHPRRKD